MESEMKNVHEDLVKIRRDVELIKNILQSEGELTDWAKSELKNARTENESQYTNLKEV
jgi:hypothetical protein